MDFYQLEQIYTDYDRALQQAHKKSSILSWIIGQGSAGDPRNDPCNREFYDKVGTWIHGFVSSSPEETEAVSICRFLMEAAVRREKAPTCWYTLVAQGYIKEVIPLLSPESRHTLAKEFNHLYPRRRRLPLQEDVYQLLAQ